MANRKGSMGLNVYNRPRLSAIEKLATDGVLGFAFKSPLSFSPGFSPVKEQ